VITLKTNINNVDVNITIKWIDGYSYNCWKMFLNSELTEETETFVLSKNKEEKFSELMEKAEEIANNFFIENDLCIDEY
jgi:predicted house-cleaning noncanonical NTP pyrophosphatase (MazG superfamily)